MCKQSYLSDILSVFHDSWIDRKPGVSTGLYTPTSKRSELEQSVGNRLCTKPVTTDQLTYRTGFVQTICWFLGSRIRLGPVSVRFPHLGVKRLHQARLLNTRYILYTVKNTKETYKSQTGGYPRSQLGGRTAPSCSSGSKHK